MCSKDVVVNVGVSCSADDDDGVSHKLRSLRTKQCILSCELSSNSENADRSGFRFLHLSVQCHCCSANVLLLLVADSFGHSTCKISCHFLVSFFCISHVVSVESRIGFSFMYKRIVLVCFTVCCRAATWSL